MVLVDKAADVASSTTTEPERTCEWEARMKDCILQGGSFKCNTCANSTAVAPCCSCHNGENSSATPTMTTTTPATPTRTAATMTTTTTTTTSIAALCKPWCASNANKWEK